MRYLTMNDEADKTRMLVEMRLEDAPQEYIEGLRRGSLSHVRSHYVWWMEDDNARWSGGKIGWREYVKARFVARKQR